MSPLQPSDTTTIIHSAKVVLGEMKKIGIYASTRPAVLPKSTHLFASHSPLLVILVWRDELLSTRLSQQSMDIARTSATEASSPGVWHESRKHDQ